MHTLTRRDALRASSLALAAPLTGFSFLDRAQAQNASPTGNQPQVQIPHLGLCNYVIDHISETSGNIAVGAASIDQVLKAASSVRMFSRHLRSCGVDAISMKIAESIDPRVTDYSELPAVALVHRHLSRNNPSVSLESVKNKFKFAPDLLANAKQSLASHGLTWHLDCMADFVELQATNPSSTRFYANTAIHYDHSRAGAVRSAIYEKEDHPHLVHANLADIVAHCTAWMNHQICKFLANDGLNATFQIVLSTALLTLAPAAACEALVGGAIIVTGATDGGGAVQSAVAAAGGCAVLDTAEDFAVASGYPNFGVFVSALGAGLAVNNLVNAYRHSNCS